MKQILHIFQKDVRRLWIEILLAVVAAALFAWVTPRRWIGESMEVAMHFQLIGNLAGLLVPVSWGLLMARLIHGEVLVGDRQFWITRPYEWPKLLAAKALFIALFLYLPFLLMEVVILLEAGFNPFSYVPGLLYRLLLISLVFFPLIALATVTSNLARMVLTVLGVLVAFIVVATTFAVRYNGSDGPVRFYPDSLGGLASIAAVLLVCGAVVVLQYARRRVLAARLLLGSTPFLVLLISSICNSNSAMNRVYPAAAPADASVIRMIAFDQDVAARKTTGRWMHSDNGAFSNVDRKKWAVIQVMLRASGAAAGDRWQLDAFRPTLTPANGVPLELDWQRGQNVIDDFDDPKIPHYRALDFLMRRSDYERLKSSLLTLHLEFAFTQARPAWTQRFPLPEGRFMLPGFASCATMQSQPGGQILSMTCHFPLRPPDLTTITAVETRYPGASAPGPQGNPAESGTTSNSWGDFDTGPAAFGISPIEEMSFFYNGSYTNYENGAPVQRSWYVWPGTPVTVTQYRLVRRVRTSVTIENFSISAP